jgi:hypothetical protein
MMNTVIGLTECMALIRAFHPGPLPFRGNTSTGLCEALERQKLLRFPPEFRHYLHQYIPATHLSIRAIGDPIELFSAARIGWRMPGYNFSPMRQTEILSWKSHWFLFALCGRDPIIVNCLDRGENSPVYRAFHTPEHWSFRPVADSLGQYLL